MNIIFLISVILKGIGAMLEIILQIVITRAAGLSAFGTYSTWINSADLIFWCLFSGIVKCNTYYLAGKNSVIKRFKIKYYSFYVVPVIVAICMLSVFTEQYSIWMIALIALTEVFVLDQSSTMLANGKYMHSLIGEYVLGRFILLLAICILWKCEMLTLQSLILAYLVQYLIVIIFFILFRKKGLEEDVSQEVSLKKWGRYQKADILQSVISQMPVILQYVYTGAIEAGVVSIVLLIKKLINFVSGPAAKIFLPEFSRLYHERKAKEIHKSFASIMKIQMIFAGPLAVVLIGYPKVVLKILAEELLAYTSLFIMCSCIFLLAATLGPCGGLMQMTENEKMDNHCREAAIAAMIITFFVLHKNPMFALYGLCVQTFCESVSKYIFVCRWMKQPPVRLKEYVSWWILPILSISATYILQLQNSFLMMIVMAGANFSVQLVMEMRREDGLQKLIHRRK